MRDFLKLAKSPDCVLAVNGVNGGRWNSGFKQSTLRNFAVNPTNATTGEPLIALRSVLHPTTGMAYGHDFRLEAAIKIIAPAVPGSYSVMYQSGGRLQLFFDVRSDGQQRFAVASSAISGASIYLPYVADRTGTHTIGLEVVGNILRFTLDGVIYEATGVRVDASGADPNRVININFNGTVSSMILTDLTASSVLYNSGAFYNSDGIYPSAVPRNFATEPAMWYAFDRAQKNIGTDDIEFEIEFYWNYDGAPATNGPIFAAGAPNSAVYLYYQSTGVITISSNLLGSPYVIMMLRTAGNPLPRGSHKVVCRVIGTSFWAQLDNEVAMTITSRRQTGLTFSPQISNFNGNIVRAQLKNLTIGKILWSYPTFEESRRLLTLLNTDRNLPYFARASATAESRVDTIVDLRGKIRSYTMMIEFQPYNITSNSQKQELAGQGAAVGSSVAICSVAYVRDSGVYNLQLSHELAGGRRLLVAPIGYPLDPAKLYTVTALIQVGTTSTTFSLYLDGVLLKSSVFAELPKGTAAAAYTNFAIGDNRSGSGTNYMGQIYKVVLLSKALSEAQIRAYT